MDTNSRNTDEYKVLRQIAALVLENPNITVREIAEKMGYAEEKSVYYWLEKAKFRGIRDFRKSVLTGKLPPGFFARDGEPADTARKVRVSVPTRDLLSFPVCEHFPVRQPGERLLCDYLPSSLGASSYLVLAREDLPATSIKRGDLLLIDPSSPPGAGDLVLAVSETGETLVLRRYTAPGKGEVLVDLADPGKPAAAAAVAGKVALIIRITP